MTQDIHAQTSHAEQARPEISVQEAGTGRPVMVLHGGGGPATVAGLAGHLAASAHTLTPTHPGWDGTPRPEDYTRIHDLALAYLAELEARDLRGVVLVGSSLGGWLAADMALYDTSRRLAGLILIDAAGIEVQGAPMRDFYALDARGVAEYSFHDAGRFYVDPATLSAEELARRRANMQTMSVYAGDPYMHDPLLLGRLHELRLPTLVLWGESDRIMTPAYGAAYAAAIPGARFELIARAGHLPQIEQPQATFALIDTFIGQLA